MRNYETMVIIDAMISDDAINAELKGIEEKIQSKAEIFRRDDWGKRKLAYAINRRTHGYYVIFYYKTEDSSIVQDLESAFRINGNVIRWMTLVDYPISDRVYGEDVDDVTPIDVEDDQVGE